MRPKENATNSRRKWVRVRKLAGIMLTLATPPELEEKLKAEAQKIGLTAEQHALNILARSVAPLGSQRSDEEFEAAIDKAQASFANVAFGTKELRALKEEEMALEEAKHQRLFGKSAS